MRYNSNSYNNVLRSIQLLPGVSNVGEGSAGFNVRGGQTDQNLILYDGMQLFNPTHALGFFPHSTLLLLRNLICTKGMSPQSMVVGHLLFWR
jgi:hypothetical protein